jgi:hypothetical protein
MKCSYHPTADFAELCSTCNRSLCGECSHRIKGKVYCQDCIVRGAEWASAVKDLRIPLESPKRAAVCSLVPGMGAVYNNEYMKAFTHFAVFSALAVMADLNGIFGFAAFAFLIFTIFDSYRTAEAKNRARLTEQAVTPAPSRDRTAMGWGIFLIFMGILFLLRNLIPFGWIHRLWPVVFIFVGVYLVYWYMHDRDKVEPAPSGSTPENNQP